MKITTKFLVLFIGTFVNSDLTHGSTAEKEDWGYVQVRPKAHMFWWLYYSTANVPRPTDTPLIIWLQGGPGASSTGFGNFYELGPLKVNGSPRNATWLKKANVMFIDNPVGTGYSYVEDRRLFARNETEIAADLVSLLKGFLKKLPAFETVPLHIFSESYGAKMAADFALALHKAIQNNEIKSNLTSVNLGDGFVSPIDSTLPYGSYLYSASVIDQTGLKAIDAATNKVKVAVENGEWEKATSLWFNVQPVVRRYSHGVDWYNILYKDTDPEDFNKKMLNQQVLEPDLEHGMLNEMYTYGFDWTGLDRLMNGPIKKKLNISSAVVWGGQSGQVSAALREDFMKPATDTVEVLLNSTNIDVVVFQGQLDLICNTPGTSAWVNRLKWPGAKGYQNAARRPFGQQRIGTVGYVKQYRNLIYYWILRAGHMVPTDQGETSVQMIDMIMNTQHRQQQQ